LTASTAATANIALILPSVAPTAGQCLTATSSTQLAFGSCGSITGSVTKNIVLSPEYVNAVLDAAGDTSGPTNCSTNSIGTMTSGNSDNSTDQNYYKWVSTQTSNQCYDIVVQVPLPSDFGSFPTTGNSLLVYATNSENTNSTSLAIEPVLSNGSADSNFGSGFVGISSGTSWSQTSVSASSDYFTTTGSGSANYTSCGYLTLRIRLTAIYASSTNYSVQLGNITIPYTTGTTN
jgi:hypothetical protein